MSAADRFRELGQQLRVDSVRSSAAAGSGHPTSSMSAADLMAVLLDDLATAGIDYDDVVAVLEREGVEKFADSFRELLEGVQAKRGELVKA